MMLALALSALASEPVIDAANWMLWGVDYAQTRSIVDHPKYYERNLFLSKNPSMASVNALFAVTGFGYLALDQLPTSWRQLVKVQLLIGRSVVVWRNYEIGLEVRF